MIDVCRSTHGPGVGSGTCGSGQPHARDQASTGRLRWAFRSKNSAWLMTAETVDGWKGLVIRNVGSGRSPVRYLSG